MTSRDCEHEHERTDRRPGRVERTAAAHPVVTATPPALSRATRDIGGLVGKNDLGTISDSYAEGDVTGRDANASTSERIGGLVGLSTGGSASISDSHATGRVEGHTEVGGLVGRNDGGTISDSYATGRVEGHTEVGGLVGLNTTGGTITDSYATTSGKVSGQQQVGGLVGLNSGTVIYSYATARVEGQTDVGGLVGKNDDGAIGASYATGTVAAARGSGVGGLVGTNSGSATATRQLCHRQSGRPDRCRRVGGEEQRHDHCRLCHR